jgi:hypothetical protein
VDPFIEVLDIQIKALLDEKARRLAESTKRSKLITEIADLKNKIARGEQDIAEDTASLLRCGAQLPIKSVSRYNTEKSKEWQMLDEMDGWAKITTYLIKIEKEVGDYILKLSSQGLGVETQLSFGKIRVYCLKSNKEIEEEARALQSIQLRNISSRLERMLKWLSEKKKELAELEKQLA